MLTLKSRHYDNYYNVSEEIYVLKTDMRTPGYENGDEVRKIAPAHNDCLYDDEYQKQLWGTPGWHFKVGYVNICSVKSRWAEWIGVLESDIEEKKNFPVEIPKLLGDLG